MSYGRFLIALLPLLVAANLQAKDAADDQFPYGMMELRGYPMQMNEDGTFKIYSGSTVFVEGSFEIQGNRMIISDQGGLYACRGKRMNPGSYLWERREDKLFLTAIEDRCGARRTAFMEAPLKTGLDE